MPRFAGQQIESWNPAIDIRSLEAGRIFILEGRNYLFDSKGPKSGFGNRLVRGGAIGTGIDIQSVDVGKETLIFSSEGAWRQIYANPLIRDTLESSTYWQKLSDFSPIKNQPFADSRWTGAYINGASYVSNPWRGMFKVGAAELVLHNAPGAPSNPVAIAEVSGRLIAITGSAFIFSGPGDGDDFVPEIAGAGFQALSQYMSGAPLGLTIFAQGCVIWGKTSAMIAEYIGGDNVFRYETLKSKLYPINATSITADVNSRAYMMTRHGLVLVEGDKIDESVTPAFNQFIREYLNENWDTKIRLDYILEDDLLYVQISDSLRGFNHTFVLNVGIDRWGEFNEDHLGVCRFGQQRGATGYADLNGFVRKWTQTPDREIEPGVLIGLDSRIDIGYFNNPDMIPNADTIVEMQELKTSALEAFPHGAEEVFIDLMGDADEWWSTVTDSTRFTYEDLTNYKEVEDDPPGAETYPQQDWGGSGENDAGPEEPTTPIQQYIRADWYYPMDLVQEDWAQDSDPLDEDWSAMTHTDPIPPPNTGGGTVIDPNEDWSSMAAETQDWQAESVDPPSDWTKSNILEGTYLGGSEDFQNQATDGRDEDWAYRNGYPNPNVDPQIGDWGTLSMDNSEDYQYSFFTEYPIETPDWTVDLLSNTQIDIDFNGPYSLYNRMEYRLTWLSSFNGLDQDIVIEPYLSMTQFNRDLWTGINSGRFQSVRFEAIERWEKFHVTSIDATIVYQGHYS